MPLPRILRRLLWVWGFFLALLLGILILHFFAPAVVQEDVPGVGQTQIVLQAPDGEAFPLVVDVADSSQEWALGLMNRPVVERGMLFVFDDEALRSFWMKNTLVPLDIAFFKTDGSWVSSARMEPCVEDPCPSTSSDGPARYALELPTGGIGPRITKGWKLEAK